MPGPKLSPLVPRHCPLDLTWPVVVRLLWSECLCLRNGPGSGGWPAPAAASCSRRQCRPAYMMDMPYRFSPAPLIVRFVREWWEKWWGRTVEIYSTKLSIALAERELRSVLRPIVMLNRIMAVTSSGQLTTASRFERNARIYSRALPDEWLGNFGAL